MKLRWLQNAVGGKPLKKSSSRMPVPHIMMSAAYRLQKAVQRNKLAFAAGAAIAAALVIGIAASVWQAVRADREATRARWAEQRAVLSGRRWAEELRLGRLQAVRAHRAHADDGRAEASRGDGLWHRHR